MTARTPDQMVADVFVHAALARPLPDDLLPPTHPRGQHRLRPLTRARLDLLAACVDRQAQVLADLAERAQGRGHVERGLHLVERRED